MDYCLRLLMWVSQVALVIKNPPTSAGDLRDVGSIPGSGRCPGGGRGNPLQCSCLENPMDRGAWRATVHRVTVTHDWSDLAHTCPCLSSARQHWLLLSACLSLPGLCPLICCFSSAETSYQWGIRIISRLRISRLWRVTLKPPPLEFSVQHSKQASWCRC